MKTFTPPEPPHSTNSHFNTTFSSMYAV